MATGGPDAIRRFGRTGSANAARSSSSGAERRSARRTSDRSSADPRSRQYWPARGERIEQAHQHLENQVLVSLRRHFGQCDRRRHAPTGIRNATISTAPGASEGTNCERLRSVNRCAVERAGALGVTSATQPPQNAQARADVAAWGAYVKQVARWRESLLGKPLDPFGGDTRKHVALVAFLAWIGLGADGLSSACYGPEEAFLALSPHTPLSLYLAAMTACTVFIIAVAYNQVIELFPSGGGGYK